MLDSKQMSLVYLMEEANRMATVCTKNVHSLHKKKTNNDIEEQMGRLFSAMREVAAEFKLSEDQIALAAESEFNRRLSDK